MQRKRKIDDTDDILFCDANGTTSVCQNAIDEMLPFLTTHWHNASSSHARANAARGALAAARAAVAKLVNAESADEIVFTSGGTESNNMVRKKKRRKKEMR